MARQRFPKILLQHQLVVEPYLGWNSYGPATTVRGLYEEKTSRRASKAGITYRVTRTFFCPDNVNAPDGSRVTLPNGAKGFVVAAVAKGGTTMPLPDHLELSIDVVAVVSSPASETVTLLRRTVVGVDEVGNDRYATEEIAVAGCTVRMAASEDNVRRGGSAEEPKFGKRVTTTLTLIMPPGTVVTAVDRLRIRGLLYEVQGAPVVLDDDMADLAGAVEVKAQRVTG